jgi:branched-chain amino acid transport system substrate-binding protein
MIYAPQVYDAVQVIAAAMQRAGSARPGDVLAEMPRTKHDGLTGLIRFDAKGDLQTGYLTLYTYRGGRRDVIAVVQSGP